MIPQDDSDVGYIVEIGNFQYVPVEINAAISWREGEALPLGQKVVYFLRQLGQYVTDFQSPPLDYSPEDLENMKKGQMDMTGPVSISDHKDGKGQTANITTVVIMPESKVSDLVDILPGKDKAYSISDGSDIINRRRDRIEVSTKEALAQAKEAIEQAGLEVPESEDAIFGLVEYAKQVVVAREMLEYMDKDIPENPEEILKAAQEAVVEYQAQAQGLEVREEGSEVEVEVEAEAEEGVDALS